MRVDRHLEYPSYYKIPDTEIFTDTIRDRLNTYLEFLQDQQNIKKK